MNAMLMFDANDVHGLRGRFARKAYVCGLRFELERGLANRDLPVRMKRQDAHLIRVRHDHRCDQALCLACEQIQIEGQQSGPRSDTRSLRHMHGESFACETHGVDADMHEDLRTVVSADGDRVPGCGDGDDLAIARREQLVPGRIDQHTIAEHALREHRIRCFIERGTPPGQRSTHDERCLTHR